MAAAASAGGGGAKCQKSYFVVLGLCCSSEVALVERILGSMGGVEKFSVVVPSRTLVVLHDPVVVTQLQIVDALNRARLEASVRTYGAGGSKSANSWPSPFVVACGLLLITSAFQHFFRPLRWLAVAAAAVGLPPILLRSFSAIRSLTFDINILMLIAVGGAVAMKDYTEAGLVVFLFTIAQWLEVRASGKATAGMSELMSMSPQKATIAETGEVVDARNVKVGTVLAVKAGEMVPIDGVVEEGQSEVDERMLTGESFPVHKQSQSPVWAGTLNLDGYIAVKTTALSEDSAVAKMVRLVEEAQTSRSQTQRLIDTCAKYYTPGIVIIAVSLALVPLVTRTKNRNYWFQLALVLLVSACPCALVLSTPVATFCALLKAARTGLLIKGGDVLEALAKTKVVAFDKTGTITRGEFTIVEFRKIDRDVTFENLLYWVSSIESKSSHPMASALVNYARLKSVEPKPDNVAALQIFPGEGIHGEIDGNSIHIGNKRIATRVGCRTVPVMEGKDEGLTVGYVFSSSEPIGIFTLADTCRSGAADAINELKALGVKTAMLTGDSTAAAMHCQSQLKHSLDTVHAELLPEDKVTILKELRMKEGHATMVGDGMNDAPALAMANVGISMGISGSAVAMETSHITLMSNDIRKIPKAIQLARRTQHKIVLNIFLSLATKVVVLAWAMAGHPLLWAAIVADVGTCLVVILNSMTLLGASHKEKACCNSKHKPHAEEKKCTSCATYSCGSDRSGGESKNGNLLGDHGSVHEHSCHHHRETHWELRKRHRHGCRNNEKSLECHDHLLRKAHSSCCRDHMEEYEQGCQNQKVHDHCCHNHEMANKHDYHKKGKKVQKVDEERYHGDCQENEHDRTGHCRSKENSCCSDSCESKECSMDSAEPPHCCHESNQETNEGKHTITIAVSDRHHSDQSHEECSGQHIVCCKMGYEVQDKNDATRGIKQPDSSATSYCPGKETQKESNRCCRGYIKESEPRNGCQYSNIRRHGQQKDWCCRNYSIECKKSTSCDTGTMQLPEIIVE